MVTHLALFDTTWPGLPKFGPIWQSLVPFDLDWPRFATFGPVRPHSAPFGPVQPHSAPFSPVQLTSAPFSPSHEHVIRTNISWKSHEQVINKSSIRHEHVLNKSWTSHNKAWTICQETTQLRLCKLGPGTVFSIRFFSEINFLSVALLSQASLVVGCMLNSTYNF